jgi:hypothetical protein
MRNRWSWVAWELLALGLLGNAVGVVLSIANGEFLRNPGESILLTLAFGSFLVVGCLLLARRPDNVIGGIFTAVGLLTMLAGLAEGYAKYAYVTHPGPLPGRPVAAWVFAWIWAPTIMLIERQQLKWFTYAGALVPLTPVGSLFLPSLGNTSFEVVIALPVAVGIAILRYRLYDIDRLINRTLVYGLLTALLAGVYVGVVLVLGQVFGGVAGNPPSWAVAGAT